MHNAQYVRKWNHYILRTWKFLHTLHFIIYTYFFKVQNINSKTLGKESDQKNPCTSVS